MESIYLPPDAATLMWSTRAIGYTSPAAVADLIDNSISANAKNIKIQFLPGENSYVSILDDGNGMQQKELELAMKYGSSSPLKQRDDGDLGRFGLGLKTASLSQCRKFTVVSKKNDTINAYCWDLDYVFSVQEWQLLKLSLEETSTLPQIEELKQYKEGTLVVWEKLDRMCAGDTELEKNFLIRIREIEDHLALTFHRFLQGEPGVPKLNIFSNGIKLTPKDPFYISKSDEKPAEKIPVKFSDSFGNTNSAVVTVTPFILPFSDSLSQTELDELGGKDGLIKNQGFYVYRNKRLIVAADWFRLTRKTDLTKLCRVRVDMPSSLDELWTIDVKKSMAVPPETVLKNLRRIVEPIVKAGKRKYKFRAIKEKKTDTVQIWVPQETRNGVIYSINPEYPIVKELMSEVKDVKKFSVLLRLIEQNIPVNSIHTDFYDDKKYAFEDVDVAFLNIKQNIRDLLQDVSLEDREAAFEEIMSIPPFSDYEITFNDLGEI